MKEYMTVTSNVGDEMALDVFMSRLAQDGWYFVANLTRQTGPVTILMERERPIQEKVAGDVCPSSHQVEGGLEVLASPTQVCSDCGEMFAAPPGRIRKAS